MEDTVAFFGAGMLGSGFVEAFRRRNVPVRVWNRTFAKAQALERFGAVAVESPSDAARGARYMHLCLRDDGAVDETLEAARAGIERGAIVIDHTTVAPAGVLARAKHLYHCGIPFMHAPVFMGPPNAAAGTGLMLCSGPPTLYERVKAQLEPMTGTLWYLGERTDKAALFKLMGNAMILATVGGLSDMFAIADANGLDRRDAFTLFEHYHPEGQIPGRGKRMAEGDYAPMWTLDMARKDAALMLASANGHGLPVIAAVEAAMRDLEARGESDRDLAVLAKR